MARILFPARHPELFGSTSLSGAGSHKFSCLMLIKSFFSEGCKVNVVTEYKPLDFSVCLFEL